MKKHNIKEWMIAARAWSFPASAMPVIVSMAYIYWAYMDNAHATADSITGNTGGFTLWPGAAALVLIIILHAAGNAWSDWFDFRKGVDTKDTYGATSLTGGLFTPKEIMAMAVVLICMSAAGGIALAVWAGMPLFWIGIGGIVCLLIYPLLKYHAAGDMAIFLAFGILPAFGTEYVTTRSLNPDILWPIIPVSLITVAILHANNTRDTGSDTGSNIRTIPIAFGPKTARCIYYTEIIFPFLWVAACSAAGLLPLWALITMAAAIPAAKAIRTMAGSRTAGLSHIRNLDAMTARIQTVFSLLLAASLVSSGLFQNYWTI